MNYYEINDIAWERLTQLQQEAALERRIRSMQEDQRGAYRNALAEIGHRLISIGQGLQERYGADPSRDLASEAH